MGVCRETNSIELLEMEVLEQAAGCLRTVAHPHRLRMLQLLLQGEFTVGELAESCNIPSSGASEHLGKMRDRGLAHKSKTGSSNLLFRCRTWTCTHYGAASKITSVERPTFSYQLTPTTQLLAHTVHTRTMQQ